MVDKYAKGLAAAPIALFVMLIVAFRVAIYVLLILLIFFTLMAVLYFTFRGVFYLAGLRNEVVAGVTKVALLPICGLFAYVIASGMMNGPTRCGDEYRREPYGVMVGKYFKDSSGNVIAICWPHLPSLPASVGREWRSLFGNAGVKSVGFPDRAPAIPALARGTGRSRSPRA